tara:strand:+ start:199 stop:2157 length:1959 start_codon:yes stop_codon:yes gene_type:complete
MPFANLQFKPGVVRDTTSYTNEGGWFDSNKIRFKSNLPEKIGGWAKYSTNSFLGICRSLFSFIDLSSTKYMGVGTGWKMYIEEGGTFYDVTPIRLITAAGDVTFAASTGSSTITITDTSHGAIENDFVTFSGAVSLGGVITAGVLNQEYQIVSVPTVSTYTIQARTAGTSIQSITVDGQLDPTLVSANSSDTGNGGGSVVGTYQINTGLAVAVGGTGWGAGAWSSGTWAGASPLTAANTLRVWSQDNFGEDLLFGVRDGGIFYWDTSADTLGTDRGTAISSLSGAQTSTPTVAKQVMLSDRDRHVICFGCDDVDSNDVSTGVLDPLLIRFSDQESVTVWTPDNLNPTTNLASTAGSLRLGAGTQFICAIETRQRVLVFTDVSVHAMQYLGPPFTFGIDQISENTTIAGPLAAKAVDDMVFWMGVDEFYVYNGQVQKLPCDVLSYVFSDFNYSQIEQVTAALNSSFGEIWWFYCPADSTSLSSYVVFNYEQNIWYYGTLPRSAWMDRGKNTYPIAASTDGYLYNHEFGLDDGSTSPASAITSYIESSQMDIGQGENFVFLTRLIPDLTFDQSTDTDATVDMTLKTRNYPGGSYLQTDTSAVTKTASTPVQQFTNQKNIRLRGRSFALKVESNVTGVQWRLGTPRVEIIEDGRR